MFYIMLCCIVFMFDIPYKMKHWREYYLTKHKRKHFGGINIGDFDKITNVN